LTGGEVPWDRFWIHFSEGDLDTPESGMLAFLLYFIGKPEIPKLFDPVNCVWGVCVCVCVCVCVTLGK
jgi:hypothetical protein